MDNKMDTGTVLYKHTFYPAIELFDFDTADEYHVDHGLFISKDFIDADDNSLSYRIIDNTVYGYLPREFMNKCTEDEAREYIKKEIG